MSADDFSQPGESARRAGRSLYRVAIDVLLTGVVVIIPLVVTLYVLSTALDLIAGAFRPFVRVMRWAGLIEGIKSVGFVDLLITVGLYQNVVDFLTTLIAALTLLAVIVAVGTLARFHHGERLIDYFDYLIGTIPGIGPVYRSFRQMGEVMLESGVENFQSVKLVEFPFDDVYVLGFETSQSATSVMAAANKEDMVTLFLPLAPNPVMGGFLTHVPRDRVMDVDMTVEDAVRTIITSGIATEEPDAEAFRELEETERQQLGTGAAGPAANPETAGERAGNAAAERPSGDASPGETTDGATPGDTAGDVAPGDTAGDVHRGGDESGGDGVTSGE